MKTYPIVDLTGDSYLNPPGYIWNDNEGSHERKVGQITSISVHHDAVSRPHDYDSVGRYHTEAAEHYLRLGMGLQYHYKIDNVGTIFAIRPLTTWLNVVGSAANVTTLAVCLDGDFQSGQQEPTQEQFEALKQLLDNLSTQHPEFPAAQAEVFGHRYFSATDCPGDNLIGFVDTYRSSGGAVAIPQVGYDWPSLQPGAIPPTPTVAPPPAPHPAPTPAPAVPQAPTVVARSGTVTVTASPGLNLRTSPQVLPNNFGTGLDAAGNTIHSLPTGSVVQYVKAVTGGVVDGNPWWLVSIRGNYFSAAGTTFRPPSGQFVTRMHLGVAGAYAVGKRVQHDLTKLVRKS